MRSFGLILGLLMAGSLARASEAPDARRDQPSPVIGPFSMSMSIDEALRAAPGVQWEKTVSKVTGRVLSIKGAQAWSLGDVSYGVDLHPLAYRWADMELKGTTHGGDVGSCRSHVLALAAALETQFPKMDATTAPFEPEPRPSGSVQVQRTPDGHVYVTGQPDFAALQRPWDSRILTAGKGVRVLEVMYEDGHATWGFEQRDTDDLPHSVRAFALFDLDTGDIDNPATGKTGFACFISADLKARPRGRPAFDMLDVARVRPIASPSKAILHRSIDGLELPKGGVAIEAICDVVRQTGVFSLCRVVGGGTSPSPSLMAAAEARLMSFRFDPLRIDPDSDVTLQAKMSVLLSPSDRDPKLAAAAGPVPVWDQVPSPAMLSREYPEEALQKEIRATVIATCRIQDDLRVSCSAIETNPPGLGMFGEPARRVLGHYRARPLLRNGAQARGAEVRIPIRFEIAN